MYRPKKYQRLEPLARTPKLSDVRRLLEAGNKARACTVEQPWRSEKMKLPFSLTVRVEVGGSEPIWTIGNAFRALKARAGGRNEPSRQPGRAARDLIALNHDRIDAGLVSGQSCAKPRSAGANDQEGNVRAPFCNRIELDCAHGVA